MEIVLDYENDNIDKEYLLGGYFSDNLMYRKNNEKNEEKGSEIIG